MKKYLATNIISNLSPVSTNPEITIDKNIILKNISSKMEKHLIKLLTIKNPKFLKAKQYGRSTWNIPATLKFYEKSNGTLSIPKGMIHFIPRIKNAEIIDKRVDIPLQSDIKFHGILKPFQEYAVQDVLEKDYGVLEAATGAGKTVMAVATIAKRKQTTLIVVHTLPLLKQWVERINYFLKIPKEEIGVIGGGQKVVKEINVGMVQTLVNFKVKDIGFIIVDESHRVPSRVFTDVVNSFNPKYILGLTATPFRNDGLSKLIFWYLGNKAHTVNKKELVQRNDVLPLKVVLKNTNFRTIKDGVDEYQGIINDLISDKERNTLIASDIKKEMKVTKGIILVLTDRKKHIDLLQNILLEKGVQTYTLSGNDKQSYRESVLKKLSNEGTGILIATGQLIGEGFDLPILSTLFLITPLRYEGRVIQYIGRILRPSPEKKYGKVIDYVDQKVPVLLRSAQARQKIYKK